ncbi:hypothetical protein HER32_03335 [Hymenobacter sp. BT18]|uniref:hypothetical protein n=1 Tax=Hymenobacter sp. BT18 TaxID=2835648 RepID=UPI00143E25C7|nr:hypothetical protein [Hymenobacter sp. BT18]QIX60273.1 hypothetical protein HER32_03335 [Hymenobacter sp. BT18]
MSAPTNSGADFTAQKTTEELLFLARNPSLYHQSLVDSARRELQRRGQLPAPEGPAEPMLPLDGWEDEPDAVYSWPRLVLGGVATLAVAGGLWWAARGNAPAPTPAAESSGPPVLVSVETHQIPAFTAEVESDLKTLKRQLPNQERRDTTATRKYLLLARRFWTAEHQTAYFLEHLPQVAADSTLTGQAELIDQEWHRLTSVLVYNHKLRPVMTERLALMRDIAHRRMEALILLKGRYSQGLPLGGKELQATLQPVPNLLAELQGQEATIEGGQLGG